MANFVYQSINKIACSTQCSIRTEICSQASVNHMLETNCTFNLLHIDHFFSRNGLFIDGKVHFFPWEEVIKMDLRERRVSRPG